MRALIAVFSITGTTLRVAENIAEGLEAAGAEVVLHNLRDGPLSAEGFDIAGIGFPVHYYRPAAPVAAAISGFGRLDGRSGFVFALNGTYRGNGLDQARSMMRRQGATEIGAFSSYGTNRFLGYTRRGYQFSPDHPTADELSDAREFGHGLVSAHASAQAGHPPNPRPSDPRTPLILTLERLTFSPRLVRSVFSRAFRADLERCSRCGQCARACPNHNITWHKGDTPTWARDCLGCFACAEVCPEEAVRSALDWPVFRPFLAYNIRHTLRDPALERVRVKLHKGKIVRI